MFVITNVTAVNGFKAAREIVMLKMDLVKAWSNMTEKGSTEQELIERMQNSSDERNIIHSLRLLFNDRISI